MARLALPVVEQLEHCGADVDAVLDAAGLRLDELEDPDCRIEHERWVALLEIGAEAAGDPDFGMHSAERLSPRSESLPGLLLRSLPTVAEGVDRLVRYLRVAHEGLEVKLILEGEVARCRLAFLPGLAHPRVLSEHLMGRGMVMGIQVLGPDCPRPLEARFAHSPPANTVEHERVMCAPVVFGAEHTEIVFAPSTLSLPLDGANPHLSAILEEEARRMAKGLPVDESVLGRCVAWIRAELHAGREPRLAAMAEALPMGARTLRRRLEAEGTTLRTLVNEARREMAEAHVADGRLSVDEIALLLGFSEAAAFRRAFKRWTGRTPSEYRHDPDR